MWLSGLWNGNMVTCIYSSFYLGPTPWVSLPCAPHYCVSPFVPRSCDNRCSKCSYKSYFLLQFSILLCFKNLTFTKHSYKRISCIHWSGDNGKCNSSPKSAEIAQSYNETGNWQKMFHTKVWSNNMGKNQEEILHQAKGKGGRPQWIARMIIW